MNDLDRHPRGLLALHAEGSLDPPEAASVAEHLAGCPACLRVVEDWRSLYLNLTRLPRPAVPSGLRGRILDAIARESARALARAEMRRRQLVAALSWAYAAGVTVVAGLGLGLAFVPEVRQAAGTGLAAVSAAGLRTGLTIVDGLSWSVAGANTLGRFFSEQMNWVRAIGRALETAGGAAGPSLAGWLVLLAAGLLCSAVFVRFLHQRDPEQEVSHVGPMLA